MLQYKFLLTRLNWNAWVGVTGIVAGLVIRKYALENLEYIYYFDFQHDPQKISQINNAQLLIEVWLPCMDPNIN